MTMTRGIRLIFVAFTLGTLAAPVMAAPPEQLTRSVATRLESYRIDVAPERLTTAQAAALHILLISGESYLDTRRRAKVILRNPDFRD